MDYFDKNFKDQFDGQNSDLPEGFGWEEMKGGIQDKMDANKPAISKKWWSLLLILVVGGCGSWMTYSLLDNTRTDGTNASIEKSIVNNSNGNDPNGAELKEVQTPENNTTSDQLQTQNKQSTTDLLNSTIENGNIEKRSIKNFENKIAPQNSTLNVNNKSKKNIAKNNINIVENNLENSTLNNSHNIIQDIQNAENLSLIDKKDEPLQEQDEDNNSKSTIGKIESIKRLIYIPQVPLIYNYSFEFLPEPQEVFVKEEKEVSKEKFPIRIGIAAGALNWLELDKQDISYNYLSGYPGIAVRPSVEFSISKHQKIELAYQYAKLNQLFDYEGIRNYQEDRPDALVAEVVNSLTGASLTQTRKDTFVNASQHQKVVKYNEYNLHNLQLSYGYGIDLGARSRLMINAGAEYAFYLNGKGKELIAGNIVKSFNRSNSDLSRGRFAGRVALNYEFVLTDKIGINFGFNGSKYFTKWGRTKTDTRRGPLLYGIQLGLKRSLY